MRRYFIFVTSAFFLLTASGGNSYQIAKFTQKKSAVSSQKQQVFSVPKINNAAKASSKSTSAVVAKKEDKIANAVKQINDSIKTKYVIGVGLPFNSVLRENLPKIFYLQSNVDFAQGALWVLIKDKNVLITDVVKAPTDQTVKDRGAIIKKPGIGAQFVVDGYAQLCEMTRRPEAKNQMTDMKLFGQCVPEECSQGSSHSETGSVAARGNRKQIGDERSCQQRGGSNNLFNRPSQNREGTSDRLLSGHSSRTDACKPYQQTPGSDSSLNPSEWSASLGADPRRSSGSVNSSNATGTLQTGLGLLAATSAMRSKYPDADIWIDDRYPQRGIDGDEIDHIIIKGNKNIPDIHVSATVKDIVEATKPKEDEDKPKEKNPKVPDKVTPPKVETPKQEPPKDKAPKADAPKPDAPSGGGIDPNNPDLNCPPEVDGCSSCQGSQKHCQELGALTRIHLGYKDSFRIKKPRDVGPYANPGESAGAGGGLNDAGKAPNLNPRINPANDNSTFFCDCGSCNSPFATFLIGDISMKTDLCKEINSPECDGTTEGAVVNTGTPANPQRPLDDNEDDDDDDEND